MKFVFLLLLFTTTLGLSDEPRSVYRTKNWGLANSQERSHIDALSAWKIEEGSKKVVVAVVDSGIDPNHVDLKENLWHDPSNPHIYGWNFISDSPNPLDDHGHGSHVAGIIGAIPSYAGVSGVAHHVSIMAVKYYSEANTGQQNLRNSIKSLNYAIDHGANIINYSGGGPEFSEGEYLTFVKAQARGILIVAAAGNERQDTDNRKNYYYPAAYHLSNVITVMSTDIHNGVVPSSNWGKTTVDVAAPGEQIYSTLPGNRYGYMTGTSQATAFVTGISTLLLSKNPCLTPEEIKDIIMKSVDKFDHFMGANKSSGRVNAYSALKYLDKNFVASKSKTCKNRKINEFRFQTN